MENKKSNAAKGTGVVSVAVQEGLQCLSRTLAQRSHRLGPKGLRILLLLCTLTGTASGSFVIWRSLQSPVGKHWQVTPIKAFPVPAPVRSSREGQGKQPPPGQQERPVRDSTVTPFLLPGESHLKK